MNAPKTVTAVVVDIETARIIRVVFLPMNPNKMRSASPEVVAAVKRFIELLDAAEALS